MTVSPDLISSASNPRIKRLRSLERKKGRAENSLFLAEGARLIEQALAAGWEVETLVISNSGSERDFVQALAERVSAAGGDVLQVPDRLAGSIARKDNPQSVIAAIKQRPLTLNDLDTSHKGLWIGLYECRDPGNLGTILRTADCADVAGVIMIEQCCDPYSVEAVRASMGSLFDVRLARADFATFNIWRKTAGLNMVAASVNGDTSHVGVDFVRPSLILMGNEQSGLPDAVEAECNTLCLIPMRGGADSLNLAQATAIMLYEGWRQRGFA
ncbi:RNA methyltransferase [Hyphomonas sp. FCG-A18]|uniref:TrmH family RNA methyltransferase n=1 Tax=Hyphomonas sp. FCG-A18 TaxID=3080019 RepID=UPI002B2BA3CE|nr:RNA methyltransferase [Hyphomonas sp. FCG-A18]